MICQERGAERERSEEMGFLSSIGLKVILTSEKKKQISTQRLSFFFFFFFSWRWKSELLQGMRSAKMRIIERLPKQIKWMLYFCLCCWIKHYQHYQDQSLSNTDTNCCVSCCNSFVSLMETLAEDKMCWIRFCFLFFCFCLLLQPLIIVHFIKYSTLQRIGWFNSFMQRRNTHSHQSQFIKLYH